MWVLRLNDMRNPRVEIGDIIFQAGSKEELKAFLTRETVEQYWDGKWSKVFRQGGPLEWFNPPSPLVPCFLDVGSEEFHVQRAREQYRRIAEDTPKIPGSENEM